MSFRQSLAVLLCAASASAPAYAQLPSIEPVKPDKPVFIRPYMAPEVPPIRENNSPRLDRLVRAGALYLTAQDAIALALENNIDLEVARYNPLLARWRLQRSEAGGLLPGVPNVASQAGSVAAGQGISGSQTAAGVRGGGFGNASGQTANATIQQIGPVTQNLDPAIQHTAAFAHTSTPQANTTQSAVTNLVSDTRVYNTTYQQGFLSGGQATVGFRSNYLSENSPTNVLNPSTATNFSFSGQHNLLRGFGTAVNARTITVSRLNLQTTDLNFRNQVIAVVTQVLNSYYALASSYDGLKAKTNAAEVAQTFFNNVRQQVDVGAVAPPELITAERQMITSRNAVVDSEATLRQQEIRLKNLISRRGTADPLLAGVRIIPVDRVTIPAADNLPPVAEMVKLARANRADLAAQRINEQALQVNALGTRNGVLPTLAVFGAVNAAGLAGNRQLVPGIPPPDPSFVGGFGTASGQSFRFDYPTERIGVFLQTPLRNRQAQADQAIDQLSIRQNQLSNWKNENQVEVDVMNSVITMQQARARYDAARKNRQLREELHKAEARKFELGASTPYEVIQQQRDMITAQNDELTAAISYSTAKVTLDQVLGRTLETNNIAIAEAGGGVVSRESELPAEIRSRQ